MTQGKSGTKRKPRARRKRKATAIKKTPRGYTHEDAMRDNGWFELISYFDPERVRNLTLKDDKAQRVFLLGNVNETPIVQVPRDAPESAVARLGKTLADSGIKALIVGDDAHWCRFRRCTPDEEKVLDDTTDSDKEETKALVVPWKPGQVEPADADDSADASAEEPEH